MEAATDKKSRGDRGQQRRAGGGRRRSYGGDRDRYYAFFDAEYTCFMEHERGFDRRHSSEVLSVGLVITDRHFNVAATYYSAIKPHFNPKLTGYCKSLTGLTQKEINEAPDYDTVFERVSQLFNDYPVKEIFVWGSDRRTLEDDARRNHRSIPRKTRQIIGKVTDITKRLTSRIFGVGITVSLADMKYICDMDHETAHNAFEDAMDLYQITKCCIQETYNKEKAADLFAFIGNRNTYHHYRRFKYPDKVVNVVSDPGLKKASKDYISVLKEVYDREGKGIPAAVLALCDDVRSLAAMGSQDCPKLPE